ncbi:MAG: GerAB/ArcD/ProY family transporter [Ectobacillus sp.]
MREEQKVPKNRMFDAYLVLFAIVAAQTGIGLAVFQRFVYMHVQQDAWFAVILASLYVHITVYVIVKTLQRYKDKDIYDIHRFVFGKWLGAALNFILILYGLYAVLMVTVTYYEILATYMFPEIPGWFVSGIMLILCIYAIFGGIRVLMGICFFSVIMATSILVVLYQLYQYFDVQNFFPMFEAPPQNYLKAVYEMSLSLAGFELLYFYFPYVKQKEQVQSYGQIGAFITNLQFLYLMILAIGFFGGQELIKSAWPTLSMFKVVRFPFLEQYQVVVLGIFMIALLPILALYLWSLTKGMKKQLPITQKQSLYAACGIIFIISLLFKTRTQIYNTGTVFNKVAFYMAFVYPYILFVASFIIDKIKNRKSKQNGQARQKNL